MGFRTEMGLYYSYFKTIVEAKTFAGGLDQLVRNNVTEYPDTINVLKRFNLYPELFLGGLYRVYDQTWAKLGWQNRWCYNIGRGEGMTDVESCEGLGEPTFFYTEGVWACAAMVFTILFLMGADIGDGIVGGLLTVMGFLYNHGECTRVQWTPPLRESFAYPISLMQMFALTKVLQGGRSLTKISALTILTTLYIIVWQFAQFALFTQWFAVCIIYSFGIIEKGPFTDIFKSLLIGLSIAFVLMFGNEMLFSSWLFSCLAASAMAFYVVEPLMKTSTSASASANMNDEQKDNIRVNLTTSFTTSTLKLVFVTATTVVAKQAIRTVFKIEDDAHVANILRSKFTSYQDFHTLLYTCAKEFDFLGWEMPLKTSQTLLLPSAIVAIFLASLKLLHSVYDLSSIVKLRYPDQKSPTHQASESTNGVKCVVDPVVAYHLLQTAAFGFLAIIIMRLKLFFTPQLCLLTAILCNKKYIPVIQPKAVHYSMLALLVAGMTVQGLANIKEQRNIIGEYSNYDMEELVEWIKRDLPDDGSASMGGPMPVMANLLLSTGRPVVNHPHYEDAGLRERVKQIYKIYDRISATEYHSILKSLQVKYIVVAYHWCTSHGAPGGCSMWEIWDKDKAGGVKDKVVDTSRPPLCPSLWEGPAARRKPFTKVFHNSQYLVLKV